MPRGDRFSSGFHHILLALAVVALTFRIAAPPGTMIAKTGHGAELVICTGHGPMSGMAPMGKAPASRSHSDGSCEFAAHAAHALSAPLLQLIGSTAWAPTAVAILIVFSTIGSGLAAPPPPSHAPPVLFI